MARIEGISKEYGNQSTLAVVAAAAAVAAGKAAKVAAGSDKLRMRRHGMHMSRSGALGWTAPRIDTSKRDNCA